MKIFDSITLRGVLHRIILNSNETFCNSWFIHQNYKKKFQPFHLSRVLSRSKYFKSLIRLNKIFINKNWCVMIITQNGTMAPWHLSVSLYLSRSLSLWGYCIVNEDFLYSIFCLYLFVIIFLLFLNISLSYLFCFCCEYLQRKFCSSTAHSHKKRKYSYSYYITINWRSQQRKKTNNI